jgi:phospholipase C
VSYLQSLPTRIDPRCEKGRYYLLNNYNPGYFGNGANAFTDTNANNTVFTIPPSSVPSIGDKLLSANISWKYYGDQWNNYLSDPYQLNYNAIGALHRRVLQHLQSVPVRHFHHDQPGCSHRAHSGHG